MPRVTCLADALTYSYQRGFFRLFFYRRQVAYTVFTQRFGLCPKKCYLDSFEALSGGGVNLTANPQIEVDHHPPDWGGGVVHVELVEMSACGS